MTSPPNRCMNVTAPVSGARIPRADRSDAHSDSLAPRPCVAGAPVASLAMQCADACMLPRDEVVANRPRDLRRGMRTRSPRAQGAPSRPTRPAKRSTSWSPSTSRCRCWRTIMIASDQQSGFPSDPRTLRQIALQTGGTFFAATSVAAFDRGLDAVRTRLHCTPLVNAIASTSIAVLGVRHAPSPDDADDGKPAFTSAELRPCARRLRGVHRGRKAPARRLARERGVMWRR